MRKCLTCLGLVYRYQPVGGGWMAHTIKRKAEYHWTPANSVGRTRVSCGLIVWVELQRD